MSSRLRRTIAGVASAALLAVAVAAAEEPAAPAARFPDGAALFQANCAVCHRANGAGQAGLAPPLLRYPAHYAGIPEGRRQLVLTLLFGMYGDVVVDERHFNFKMPEFTRFDDATIAAVINFVVFDLAQAPATVAALQPEEVARERALALSGEAVRHHRAEVLDPPVP